MLDNKGAGPLGKRRVLFSSTQIIALGFLGVIFLGSLLLSLPVAAASGQGTSYIDAFFTSKMCIRDSSEALPEAGMRKEKMRRCVTRIYSERGIFSWSCRITACRISEP